MSDNEGYLGISIDYNVMARGMINNLKMGYFPSPEILNEMASASEYGRTCAESVISEIEADPDVAEQYLDMLDESIGFLWC